VWLPPYTFAEGVTGVTAALAVPDPAGRVRGVLTVDFALAGLDSSWTSEDHPADPCGTKVSLAHPAPPDSVRARR
jgi:hypothetical protein